MFRALAVAAVLVGLAVGSVAYAEVNGVIYETGGAGDGYGKVVFDGNDGIMKNKHDTYSSPDGYGIFWPGIWDYRLDDPSPEDFWLGVLGW